MSERGVQLHIELTTIAEPSSLAFNILSDLQLIDKAYVPMTRVLDHFNVEEAVLYSAEQRIRGALSKHNGEYSLGVNPNLSSSEQRLELAWLLSWFLHTNIRDLIPEGHTVHHLPGAGSKEIAEFNDKFASSLLIHHIPERVAKKLMKDAKGSYTSKYAHKRMIPTRILLSRLADSIPLTF